MNLRSAKINTILRIRKIQGNLETVSRLQELGVLLDTEVTVIRRSPFAGPLVLCVGTAFIVMRMGDAEKILVEELT